MHKADVRKVLAECIRESLSPDANLPKELYPFQRVTAEKTVEWLEDPAGSDRAYVQHATGLGKTVIFSTFVRHAFMLRTLIIVPSRVLIAQTARRIAPYVGGMVGHLSSLDDIWDEAGERVIAKRGHVHHSVVITTDATFKNMARAIAHEYRPHFIIRDECHWAYTAQAAAAFAQFPDAVVVGWSATPNYLGTVARPGYASVTMESGQKLYGDPARFARNHFGTCLDTRTARWGMQNDYLAPLVWGSIEFNANVDKLKLSSLSGAMDYDGAQLQKLMRESWSVTTETIGRLYEDSALKLVERHAFAVCPGITAAHELAKQLAKHKVQAQVVTGEMEDTEREAVLRAFERREVPFLCTVQVLREGWDSWVADVCFMLRITRSQVFYEQPIGRILRKNPHDPDKVALVVDLHAQNAKFAPMSAAQVYGLPGEELEPNQPLVKSLNRPRRAAPDFRKLPAELVPHLKTVPALVVEHIAHRDGTLLVDGQPWTSYAGLCWLYNLAAPDCSRRLFRGDLPIRTRMAKDHLRKEEKFFRLDDALKETMGGPPLHPLGCLDGT